jgi:hypothetical protein
MTTNRSLYLDKLCQNPHTKLHDSNSSSSSVVKLPDISHIGIKTTIHTERDPGSFKDFIDESTVNDIQSVPIVGIDGELSPFIKSSAFQCGLTFERKMHAIKERESYQQFVEVGKLNVDKFMNKIEERHIMESSERQLRYKEAQEMIDTMKLTINQGGMPGSQRKKLPHMAFSASTAKQRKKMKIYNKLTLFKSLLDEIDQNSSNAMNTS